MHPYATIRTGLMHLKVNSIPGRFLEVKDVFVQSVHAFYSTFRNCNNKDRRKVKLQGYFPAYMVCFLAYDVVFPM